MKCARYAAWGIFQMQAWYEKWQLEIPATQTFGLHVSILLNPWLIFVALLLQFQ